MRCRRIHRHLAILGWVLLSASVTPLPATAGDFSATPYRSLFVNIDLGVGLDISDAARSPANFYGEHVEAYSAGAFLIGVNAGYRFNEVIGIEAGWHDQQHKAHPEWGGRAHYIFGHAALRLAWPLRSRQTPVLAIGPAVGQFSYGASSSGEIADNDTVAVGGIVSLALEHELTLGLVATLKIAYLPAARFGMDGILLLEETDYTSPGTPSTTIGAKDFSDDRFVQILWISWGIQFEWTFL